MHFFDLTLQVLLGGQHGAPMEAWYLAMVTTLVFLWCVIDDQSTTKWSGCGCMKYHQVETVAMYSPRCRPTVDAADLNEIDEESIANLAARAQEHSKLTVSVPGSPRLCFLHKSVQDQ